MPVIVLDHLSETQRRALVLADNKLALNAGWDDDMLRVELESLKEDAFNLDLSASPTRKSSWQTGWSDEGLPIRTRFRSGGRSHSAGDVWILGSTESVRRCYADGDVEK